jgi:hypothetical protein
LWQNKNERNQLRELCYRRASPSGNYNNPFYAIDAHPEWYQDEEDHEEAEPEDKDGALRKLLLDLQAEVAKQYHTVRIFLMFVLAALVVLAVRAIR